MKSSIFKLSMVLFVLVATFFPIDSYSNDEVSPSKKVTIVHTEWFPYTYTENGEAKGFEIEILKSVMKKIGYAPVFVSYPWKRCLFSIKSGDADALVSVLKTPEREDFMYFPDENISISKTVLFAPVDSDVKYSGQLEILKNYVVGVVDGFSYGEAFDNAVYIRKEYAVNPEMLISKLVYKRNDLAVENKAVITAYAKKMGVFEKIKFLDPPIHTQKLYVGFSKKIENQKLYKVFSDELANFKKTEEYQNILQKYNVSGEVMK